MNKKRFIIRYIMVFPKVFIEEMIRYIMIKWLNLFTEKKF